MINKQTGGYNLDNNSEIFKILDKIKKNKNFDNKNVSDINNFYIPQNLNIKYKTDILNKYIKNELTLEETQQKLWYIISKIKYELNNDQYNKILSYSKNNRSKENKKTKVENNSNIKNMFNNVKNNSNVEKVEKKPKVEKKETVKKTTVKKTTVKK